MDQCSGGCTRAAGLQGRFYMTVRAALVFLPDVDNTLFDNERFAAAI
jgi:hypothetical protein